MSFPVVPEFGPTFDSAEGFTFSADVQADAPRETYAVLPDGESWLRLNAAPGTAGRIHVYPHYADVYLGLNTADNRFPLDYTDLRFGYVLTVNGVQAATATYPEPNNKYVQAGAPYIRAERVTFTPEDQLQVTIWAEDAARFESLTSFQAPRYVQPFPSWTWANPRWEAPVPHPTDGNDYEWDEAGQQWVLVP